MIRTYTPADHDALVDLFARAGADSPTGELWRHLPSPHRHVAPASPGT